MNIILTSRTDLVHVVQWLVFGNRYCVCHGRTSVLYLGGPRFDSQPSYCLEQKYFFFFSVPPFRIPQLKILMLCNDICKIHLMLSNGTGCFVY